MVMFVAGRKSRGALRSPAAVQEAWEETPRSPKKLLPLPPQALRHSPKVVAIPGQAATSDQAARPQAAQGETLLWLLSATNEHVANRCCP